MRRFWLRTKATPSGYGDDPWTARAIARFREHFGDATDVYFTFNGTGANVVALSCVTRPWDAVLAPASAHLQTDECGAFERFTGSKVIPVATADGRLRVADLEPYLLGGHGEHFSQPRVISVSNTTEYGDVYEPHELADLCAFAHDRGLLRARRRCTYFQRGGGARARRRAPLPRTSASTSSASAGPRTGLMGGEAICFFDPSLSANVALYARKQGMQLASKMRYISAQFEALLTDDRWLQYASHSNAMAQRLLTGVRDIPGVTITRPVRPTRSLPRSRARRSRASRQFFFYFFNEALPEVRWMTHWATTESDVDAFVAAVKSALSSGA